MFSGFLGRGKKAESKPGKEAADTRGLEVVEDDPDTTWGLWESAVAEQDSRFAADHPGVPLPDVPPSFQNTQPMGFFDRGGDEPPPAPVVRKAETPDERRDEALAVVELHHSRIAKTIRSMWGYKECSQYISKLIMDGGDSKGHARMGFHQDAAAAMMVLSDLHDAQFGRFEDGPGEFTSSFTVRTGFDNLR